MIIKRAEPVETRQAAPSRAEVREALIELWARVFEAELRAELPATIDNQDNAVRRDHPGRDSAA